MCAEAPPPVSKSFRSDRVARGFLQDFDGNLSFCQDTYGPHLLVLKLVSVNGRTSVHGQDIGNSPVVLRALLEQHGSGATSKTIGWQKHLVTSITKSFERRQMVLSVLSDLR